jgi:GrpB-like predicted nucleotidyltransferase (UPF0157 family)
MNFPESSGSAIGEAPIEIVQYDPAWRLQFERERALLEVILAPWLAGPIEHIGSTAIPHMVAKPVIDIMAGVESLDASRGAISAASHAGYLYFPVSPQTHALVLQAIASFPNASSASGAVRKPALVGAPGVPRSASKRPYAGGRLRRPEKRSAAKFKLDREAYTDAKASFVQRVLAQAR